MICAALELCKFIEKKGSGFDKIEEDYRDADAYHKPYISSDSTSFTLTLPDLTYEQGTLDADEGRLPEVYADTVTTGKRDLEILAFAYQKPRTVKEIAEHLEISPSTYFRKNTIARLVGEGLLIEYPSERAAEYQSSHTLVHRK